MHTYILSLSPFLSRARALARSHTHIHTGHHLRSSLAHTLSHTHTHTLTCHQSHRFASGYPRTWGLGNCHPGPHLFIYVFIHTERHRQRERERERERERRTITMREALGNHFELMCVQVAQRPVQHSHLYGGRGGEGTITKLIGSGLL